MIGIQGNAATCVPLRAPVGEKRAECVDEVVSQGRAGEKPWAENAQKEGRTREGAVSNLWPLHWRLQMPSCTGTNEGAVRAIVAW